MSGTERYDQYNHDFRTSTHETYARMRAESPVHLQPGLDGETPIWFVTRYDDFVALLTHNDRFVLDPALTFTAEELGARRAASSPPEPDERRSSGTLSARSRAPRSRRSR
jgi:cytochrome P450